MLLASAVKGTPVFAVLTIPIEGPKTTAVLDAAIADAVSRSAAARGTGTERAGSAATMTLDAFRPAMSYSTAKDPEEPDEGGRSKRVLRAGLGWRSLRSLRAVVVLHPQQDSVRPRRGSLWHHRFARCWGASGNTAVLPQPAVDTSIVAGQVDDLLKKRRAIRDAAAPLRPATMHSLLPVRPGRRSHER